MTYKDILPLLKTAEQKILAEETLEKTRQTMLIYPETEIPKDKQDLLFERMDRLKGGEPLQYILGYWFFEDRKFEVSEGVLIPREDTGAVVSLARDFLNARENAVFADLGAGSGCISVTLFKDTGAGGYAVEKSEKAFSVLKRNIENHTADVEAVLSDMFDERLLERLPKLDLVVSNPPYISAEQMKSLDDNVLREPHSALFGGEDGLDFYRKIAEVYYPKIKAGGAICFELGFDQMDAVCDILKKAGFKNLKEQKDINEIRRAVCALK